MRTVFVGNRYRVLAAALERGLEVRWILCPPDSFLHAELRRRGLPHETFSSKAELVARLRELDFQLLISNGCPHILPISSLAAPGRRFINVHPSLLPDLRGLHPVNGALLHGRPTGATCHEMDDGMDTGPVLAQVEVDLSPDLDLGLLYQLCFMAEAEAFTRAWDHGLGDGQPQRPRGSELRYARNEADRRLDFSRSVEEIRRQVLAFGLPSQAAWFQFKGRPIPVLSFEPLSNRYLSAHKDRLAHTEVLLSYPGTLVLKVHDDFVKMSGLPVDHGIREGDRLEPEA